MQPPGLDLRSDVPSKHRQLVYSKRQGEHVPVESGGKHELKGDEHQSSPTWLFDGARGTPALTYRSKLAPLVVAAAVALAAVACDGGGGGSGTRTNEASPANTDPTGSPEPSWVTRFLDPRSDEQVRDLFEVDADHGEYWRITTLERFNGASWTSANPYGSEGGVHLSGPATLPQSGGSPPPGAEILIQTFRVLSDFDIARALPMAQRAEEISGPIRDITWDPARSQAFIDGHLEAGMEYTVRSRIVVPTPEELDQVNHLAPRTYGNWTELPADLDPRIRAIAERWTADATSDYRRVLAIQQHFHNGDFVYSTDVAPFDDAEALVEFLTRTRVGYCEHYASAMAVMVRALGLPARIAVGYRSGTRQENGSYLVQTSDVHGWVEVLFPGYGWLQFEPEPGPVPHPNAQAGTYLNPVAPTDAS
jgi:transglutaminase-like putative cysteine protease